MDSSSVPRRNRAARRTEPRSRRGTGARLAREQSTSGVGDMKSIMNTSRIHLSRRRERGNHHASSGADSAGRSFDRNRNRLHHFPADRPFDGSRIGDQPRSPVRELNRDFTGRGDAGWRFPRATRQNRFRCGSGGADSDPEPRPVGGSFNRRREEYGHQSDQRRLRRESVHSGRGADRRRSVPRSLPILGPVTRCDGGLLGLGRVGTEREAGHRPRGDAGTADRLEDTLRARHQRDREYRR